MSLDYQIAQPSDLDEILKFCEARLSEQEPDEMARTFKSWHAPWRKEALEHYLRLGWSFTARHKDKPGQPIAGFFLGQALLFLRGQTQTLWVEFLDGESFEVRAALADIAVRLSREKHLQRVLFNEPDRVRDTLGSFRHEEMKDKLIEVFTTKS